MDIILSSEDLMTRIAKGDAGAFEILVNRHQTSAINYRLPLKGSIKGGFLKITSAGRNHRGIIGN